VTGSSTDQGRPIYRSRGVLVGIVLIYVVIEAWLAIGILNHGCAVAITIDEWLPVILTLGAGGVGSLLLIRLGKAHARRDLSVLGMSLGLGAIAGVLAFYGTYTLFYCM
jgi:hypothetical protein